ncbi:MAG: hypothetical protein NUV78_03175 [Candidatus Zambryskibacteria bacterium]|nr:hypothetical protein [Candidatus Zambryskibacteria bacterium]
MSLNKEILRITARYHPLVYSQLYEYLYEETVYGKKLNKRSLSTVLNRMKRNGLLKNKDGKWSPTAGGRVYLEKINTGIKKFFTPGTIVSNRRKFKRIIIVFDIPEKKRRYRDWLRMELVGFGFTLIQKSVWLGPGLPKEFIEYLDEAGLLKHIRFFHAEEKDLI